jgi:hypothetical protein
LWEGESTTDSRADWAERKKYSGGDWQFPENWFYFHPVLSCFPERLQEKIFERVQESIPESISERFPGLLLEMSPEMFTDMGTIIFKLCS